MYRLGLASPFPMAPSQEEWDALTTSEREAVVASLPGEVTEAEMAPPEGDRHFKGKTRALDALRNYFTRQKTRIYLATELPTYYPAEPRFAPDLLAVRDVEAHDRDSWIVSREGRGLDWILEVHVGGDRKKDAETNVVRYARLGVQEYFVYDRARGRLAGYRLETEDARTYVPIVPQAGRWASAVLGLDVQLESDRLRFFAGSALLLESEELLQRIEGLYAELEQRFEEESRLRAEESRLRAEESRRREAAERELARIQEELARLKSGR